MVYMFLLSRQAFHSVLSRLHELYRDDRGQDEPMSKLLIFGLISLPLIALLILFGNRIVQYVRSLFDSVMGNPVNTGTS